MPRKGEYSVTIGQKYGTFTILEHAGFRKYGTKTCHLWKVLCSCCNEETVRLTGNITHAREFGCKSKMRVADSAISRGFRTYKRQARDRNKDFALDFKQFKHMVAENCFYCGKEPEINSCSSDCAIPVPMNGIDRYDNNLDYTFENCRPCCIMCNLGKLDYTIEQFIDWTHRVSDFQKNNMTNPADDEWLDGVGEEEE